MKTGAASRTATGWMTSIVPTPVPDAAAAAEPGEHRPDRAGHGRRAAQHLDQRVAGDDPREEHRQCALEQVAGDDDRRPLAARAPAARSCRPSARSRSSAGPSPPAQRATSTPTGIEPAR